MNDAATKDHIHRTEASGERLVYRVFVRDLDLPSLIEPLSQRELEVLQLLAQGKTNKDIASELYVATDTIKKHVTHILDKLGATNRTQAAVRARQHGLLP